MTNIIDQSELPTSVFPFPTTQHHPAGAESAHAPKTEEPTEEALDHGIEESFPASDPVSVSVTKLVPVSSAGSAHSLTESVAGEEDPGASLDTVPAHPGDEASPGTPGTGEGLCRECGGSGRRDDGRTCPACGGTGKVTVGIGGA